METLKHRRLLYHLLHTYLQQSLEYMGWVLFQDIHQRALQSLNDLTICSVELFHQIAQVVLLENPREVAAYVKRAEGIKGLIVLI